jgi:predicted KAP-like P-loop ATPase
MIFEPDGGNHGPMKDVLFFLARRLRANPDDAMTKEERKRFEEVRPWWKEYGLANCHPVSMIERTTSMAARKRTTNKSSDFTADRPIASSKADRLGRTAFANALAERIRGWNGNESLVISLCGEWGCGKTSLKNMVLESLNKGRRSKVDILQFSPWEISGHASVAGTFFRELGVALNRCAEKDPAAKAAVQRMKRYSKFASVGGTALKGVGRMMASAGVPGTEILELLGDAVAASSDVAAKGAEAQSESSRELSLAELKRLLAGDMAKLKRPLLVVIDDIDRLTTDEIREVFQLVKANADFPNLIYLLMFDRDIVARALDSIAGGRGNEFLDKIIQVLFHVPQPSMKRVHEVLFGGLDAHLAEAGFGERWEKQRWSRVWLGGLSLYFTNLRCVYRFLGSFSFQVSQMWHGKTFELNPLDLIILETLRLFEPAVYEALPSRRAILTGSRVAGMLDENEGKEARKAEQIALLALANESRRHALSEILGALFPALFSQGHPDRNSMQRQLRVGHERFFDRYFTLSLAPDDVPQADLDYLRETFVNPAAFVERCESLISRGLLDAAFERLAAYRHDIPISVFPTLITSMANVCDLLPEQDSGEVLTMDTLEYAYYIVRACLKRIDDESERYQHIRDGIKSAKGVRFPVRLLAMGELLPDGSRSEFLVSEEQWGSLKPLVLSLVEAAAKDGRLRKLKGLAYLLSRWKDWAGEDVVKNWVASELKTRNDALWILKAFLLSTIQGSGERVTYTRYMRLDVLGEFVDIDAIKRFTCSDDIRVLPQDEMRALRAFRQALKWREEGKPPEYHGGAWDGANPLEEET